MLSEYCSDSIIPSHTQRQISHKENTALHIFFENGSQLPREVRRHFENGIGTPPCRAILDVLWFRLRRSYVCVFRGKEIRILIAEQFFWSHLRSCQASSIRMQETERSPIIGFRFPFLAIFFFCAPCMELRLELISDGVFFFCWYLSGMRCGVGVVAF